MRAPYYYFGWIKRRNKNSKITPISHIFRFIADFDALLAGEVGGVEFGKLPFGACEDPIRFFGTTSHNISLFQNITGFD